LSPKLKQKDFYRASNSPELNAGDIDLGSVGPTLIGGGRMFVIGKEGLGLILSTTHLGGTGGQLFGQNACSGGAFGGLAYQVPLVYVPCTSGLYALRVNSTSFSEAWHADSSFAGPPIIAGGVVWSIDQDSILHGYAPDRGTEVANSDLGSVTHFATPSAGAGRLFAPADTRVIAFAGI
jgi:hypothetical protein